MDPELNGGAPAPAAPTAAPESQTATTATTATPQTPAALDPVEPQKSPEATLDDELSDLWDKAQEDGGSVDGPVRDEHGRFKSSKAPAPALEGGETNTDPMPDEGKPETEPSAPVHPAPPSWSGETKAKLWAALPPEAREYIAQRESEAHRAITQQGQKIKAYEPFDQLVQQHRDHFERNKISPAESFETLLSAQSALESDPVNGLVQIGLSYGIDLRPLLGVEGGLPNSGQDPMVRTLQARLQQLEGQVSQQTRAQAEAAERQAAAERTQLETTIAKFAKDHPHFEAVKPTMAALMRSGQAETLDDAYDMAIHAVPTVRNRVLAEREKAASETRMSSVSRAQRAASVNTRSIPATATPKSLDDELDAIASKHYGR